MRFNLHIECGNAAFDDDPAGEVARILRDLARRIEGHGMPGPGQVLRLHDMNGNHVGEARAPGRRR